MTDFESPAEHIPTTALSRGPARSFPELAGRYLDEYREKIRLAVGRISEDDLWWRPAPGTNSAGNLVLHLVGNLSMWLLAGVGGQEVERRRSQEFAARRQDVPLSKEELLGRLDDTLAACRALLDGLGPDDLQEPATIQGYEIDVHGAVFHAVEHMSYHTGQIVWIAKQRLHAQGDARLEFYPQHGEE